MKCRNMPANSYNSLDVFFEKIVPAVESILIIEKLLHNFTTDSDENVS